MNPSVPDADAVLARATTIFEANNAVQLATTGGIHSPWVAGAYFTQEGTDLFILLEASGKSLENIRSNPSVAFSVSQNDAMKDFLQGNGTAHVLTAEEEPAVRARLVAKMAWYQTYTPVVPVRIQSTELYVSSLASGWFPARVWRA